MKLNSAGGSTFVQKPFMHFFILSEAQKDRDNSATIIDLTSDPESSEGDSHSKRKKRKDAFVTIVN